jgi:hypothetical protein
LPTLTVHQHKHFRFLKESFHFAGKLPIYNAYHSAYQSPNRGVSHEYNRGHLKGPCHTLGERYTAKRVRVWLLHGLQTPRSKEEKNKEAVITKEYVTLCETKESRLDRARKAQ